MAKTRITERKTFRVSGATAETVPIMAWIVENTPSFALSNQEGPTQWSRGSSFAFDVSFGEDRDAVAFKLRWIEE
ncbi:hypothetical protein [Phenylobacterium terrae]|uniref:hypothetical protein n=1 Tax=Phenylobacterium terrae TaxID=2665495 RepID=UPI003672AE48